MNNSKETNSAEVLPDAPVLTQKDSELIPIKKPATNNLVIS